MEKKRKLGVDPLHVRSTWSQVAVSQRVPWNRCGLDRNAHGAQAGRGSGGTFHPAQDDERGEIDVGELAQQGHGAAQRGQSGDREAVMDLRHHCASQVVRQHLVHDHLRLWWTSEWKMKGPASERTRDPNLSWQRCIAWNYLDGGSLRCLTSRTSLLYGANRFVKYQLSLR